jgi:hypothetical protein
MVKGFIEALNITGKRRFWYINYDAFAKTNYAV